MTKIQHNVRLGHSLKVYPKKSQNATERVNWDKLEQIVYDDDVYVDDEGDADNDDDDDDNDDGDDIDDDDNDDDIDVEEV